jgi:hypothetical protein
MAATSSMSPLKLIHDLQGGPSALDTRLDLDRIRGIGATLNASLDRFSANDRQRLVELGSFTDARAVAMDQVFNLWQLTGRLSPKQSLELIKRQKEYRSDLRSGRQRAALSRHSFGRPLRITGAQPCRRD